MQITRAVVQVPGDDGKGERARGDVNGRAGAAAAQRQRERAEDESSDVAV
jgi:hypothetical protein